MSVHVYAFARVGKLSTLTEVSGIRVMMIFLIYFVSDREFCIVYFIDSSRSNSIVLFSLRNVVWILNEKRAQNCEGNLVVQLYEI